MAVKVKRGGGKDVSKGICLSDCRERCKRDSLRMLEREEVKASWHSSGTVGFLRLDGISLRLAKYGGIALFDAFWFFPLQVPFAVHVEPSRNQIKVIRAWRNAFREIATIHDVVDDTTILLSEHICKQQIWRQEPNRDPASTVIQSRPFHLIIRHESEE